MTIAEVMTSTVYTIYPKQTIYEAAKKMAELNIGSLVLIPKENSKQPIGIITERDIVTRVIAQGKDPKKALVSDNASRPVVTVSPSFDVSESMKTMAKLNIRRIVIVENNEVVGICTYRDLIRVVPALLSIALEVESITSPRTILEDFDIDKDLNYLSAEEIFEKEIQDLEDEIESNNNPGKEDEDEDFEDDEEEMDYEQKLSTGFYCTYCGLWIEGEPTAEDNDNNPLCEKCAEN
jgi:CBS domain-containing protein